MGGNGQVERLGETEETTVSKTPSWREPRGGLCGWPVAGEQAGRMVEDEAGE